MQIAWASETPGTTQIAWAPVRDSSIGNTLERSPPKAGFFLLCAQHGRYMDASRFARYFPAIQTRKSQFYIRPCMRHGRWPR
jgi:hypothetical protein